MIEAFLLGRWMGKCGIIHAHFGGSVAAIAMVMAEIWGLDYSLTIHGPEEFCNVDDSYLRCKNRTDEIQFLYQ